jgi:hypothetical protein
MEKYFILREPSSHDEAQKRPEETVLEFHTVFTMERVTHPDNLTPAKIV